MAWYCKNCIKDITPFSNLTDIEFEKLINGKTLIPKKLNENHASFFDQVHCLVENDDVIDCKYYDINKFKRLKLHENNEKFSLLHMNISSLPYHFDNFQQLLLNLKIDFDIIGITESRIKNKKAPASSIDLIKYNTEQPKPTRLTTHSKALIDNIFDNNTDENSIAGNLTSPISDHLAQFLIYTNRSHRTTTISK